MEHPAVVAGSSQYVGRVPSSLPGRKFQSHPTVPLWRLIASLMYYEGDLVNRITIGRNMRWAAISSIVLNGSVYVGTTTPNSGAAFVVGGTSTSTLYIFLNGLRISGRDISIYHNIPYSPLTFHTGWGSTSNDYISFNTRATARLTKDGVGVLHVIVIP